MRKYFLFSLLFVVFYYSGYAQNRTISVSYDRNASDEYVFFAENRSNQKYSVVVYFKTLMGLTPDTRLPAVKTISPGKNRLFKLSKSGIGSPNFNWGWSYNRGTADPSITDYTYALPIAPGKETKTIKLTSLNESYGDGEKPEGYYAIGFKMNEGDTIFASRGGKVVELTQDKEAEGANMTFTRSRNIMEIEHEDGTLGRYTVFKKGSAMVELGDEVVQGQALALAEGRGFNSGYHLRFQVYYLKFNKEADHNSKDFFSWAYETMKFKAVDIDPKVLMPNIKYIGYLDDDMITQEMSKREKKRYFKSKASQ